MAAEAKPVEEMAYEEALAELERIVAVLEVEEKSLEEAISMYERGQALARRCSLLLEQAELRVRTLETGADAEGS